MVIHISKRERYACKVLKHFHYDKPDDIFSEELFADCAFNKALVWICVRILKVNVIELIKKVQFYADNPSTEIIYG